MSSKTITISPDLWGRILKAAKRECWTDNEDFSAYEYCGGNYDDAYQGGCEDGYSDLAMCILIESGEADDE